MIAAHIEPILIVTGAVTAMALINLLTPLRSPEPRPDAQKGAAEFITLEYIGN
jgi:hypothetical protein